MQPIRDKDFDQLFKDAFADAEVTPSRDLWSGIESEITPKKKRIVPVYWLSAAAVLLMATIGILVYQQQDTVTSGGKKLASNAIEKTKPVVEVPAVKDSAVAGVEPVENTAPILPLRHKAVSTVAKTKVKQEVVKPVEKPIIVTAPDAQKQDAMIAQVQAPKNDIKTIIDDVVAQTKTETVTASDITSIKTDDPINDNEQSSKGIRNVGDVVNLIVNKMDKRKDKLIQFRTDDDDSSLASINIGPFKIGKRKK
ncbi:hypothetical protein ACS5PU_01945 [Pedobacter sp. GSP4]|uniref:hypothetical protein n=1 Tax=Pedobacter sp. GSP4 TaxID=3453716 RepID=UPI003EED3A6D